MAPTPHPRVRLLGHADPLRIPELARQLTQSYFIWDGFVAGARRVDLHPLVLPDRLHELARSAAEAVTRVVSGVARRALHHSGERRLYGLHPDVERLAEASDAAGDDAALVRVDLLLNAGESAGEGEGVTACEINADCPGGHNEAFGLPRLARAAGYLAGGNPTMVVEALASRLAELAAGGVVALIFATAYAEDLQVCALLQRELTRRGVEAILAPATAPKVAGREVVVRGRAVKVVYRFFPTEYMEGQSNLGGLADAIAGGRVRTLTGFSHIYTQSKYAFARAWGGRGELSGDDRRVVTAHLPPTYDVEDVPPRDLVADREGWVLKRAYGRVGDEVLVGPLTPVDMWRDFVEKVRGRRARGESWIAQRFVRQATVPTPWGERYVTLGVYVLDGKFVGYFARLTRESHVSHGALCVPVFHAPTPEAS